MMEVDECSESSGSGVDTLKRRADSDTIGKEANNSSEQAGHPRKVDVEESKVNVVDNSKRVRTTRSSPKEADEAGSESPVIPEKLEVPSKELQCIQKQVLIEKLMGSTTCTTTTVVEEDELMDIQSVPAKNISNKNQSKKQFRVPTKPPSLNHEDFKRTFKVRSSLLDRVKTFLPELKNSNEELLRLPDPSKISLESDSDDIDGAVAGPSGFSDKKEKLTTTGEHDDKPYVEMNFALLEQSDSDTSSDDDEGIGSSPSILPKHVKGLPTLNNKDTLVSVINSDTDDATSSNMSTKESPIIDTGSKSGPTDESHK